MEESLLFAGQGWWIDVIDALKQSGEDRDGADLGQSSPAKGQGC